MTLNEAIDQPQIAAERLDLRPLRMSDTGLLTLYSGDARVAKNTASIPHPLPPGASEAFVERANAPGRDEDVWAMDGARAGLSELLGVISMARMDRSQSEIGFWVAPVMWNTGFASEALDALVAANPHDARTLFAAVFQDNQASAKVLTHAGFDYIGDAEAYCVARGAKVQTWTYIRQM